MNQRFLSSKMNKFFASQMKVAILTHTFPRSPKDTAAPFMGNLAEALSKYVKLYVLVPFDENLSISSKAKYKFVFFKYFFIDKMHILGYSRTLQDDKRLGLKVLLLSPLYILMGIIALIRLIKKEEINIVSAHWIIPNGFISFVVSKFTKVPYTVTIPGSDIYLASKNKLFYFMAKLAAEGASVVISDNKKYLDQLSELSIKPKKEVVINYGANSNKFKVAKKDTQLLNKFKLKKETIILLAVGRLVQKKGFLYLIRALPLLRDLGKRFKLIIIGDGDQRQNLENECQKMNLEDQVKFIGTIDYQSLFKFYNLADIFIMPSIKDDEGNIDASPVALMEAMLSGLMVVTTKGTIDGALAQENEFLIFIKERKPKQIAEAILDLAKKMSRIQPSDRKSKIRSFILKQFSIQSVAERYFMLFSNIG